MITKEQVYGRLQAATAMAARFHVQGYDTHDLATEAVLHLLRRSQEANDRGEVIEDFTHWSTRIMRRRIIDLRRGTINSNPSSYTDRNPPGEWERDEPDSPVKTINESPSGSSQRHVPLEAAWDKADDHQENPLAGIIRREEHTETLAAIRRMNASDQETMALTLSGLSDETAAKMLGIPRGAFQMRKSRAIRKLRDKLVSA